MQKLRHPKVWPFLLAILSAAVLNFAFFYPSFILVIVGLLLLFPLQYAQTRRLAFYPGLLAGFLIYAVQLQFFFTIFSFGAAALWLVLSFWIGLFCVLARELRSKFSAIPAAFLIATAWAGLELFRSELYYLRFSWLSVGQTAILDGFRIAPFLGEFGVSFLIALGVAFDLRHRRPYLIASCALIIIGLLPGPKPESTQQSVMVTGIQMEFPTIDEVTNNLSKALNKYPATDIFVLSEYTFAGPVPRPVFDWCRENQKHLVLGAHDPAGENYYNTAFVVSPEGKVVFKQAKSVPIQFFKDGLPAANQEVWDSPWGKIGFGVCYDLSYRKVTDRLIRKGAQMLIFPTMDLQEWGAYQHELNARQGYIRAKTYQVPVVRVCSSGISQMITADRIAISEAGFPGQGEIISATLQPSVKGKLPMDFLAGICGLIVVFGALVKRVSKKHEKISKVPGRDTVAV